MPWTEKDDARLRELADDRLSTFEIAAQMGKSRSAVKARAARVGVRIYRPEDRVGDRVGIKPFTPKCEKLMKQAGVRL